MTMRFVVPVFLLTTLALVVNACSPIATPEPIIQSEIPTVENSPAFTPLPEGRIEFSTADGTTFDGKISGSGKTALILANMSSGTETQWLLLTMALDPEKFTTVTFNYFEENDAAASQAILGVVETLRDAGYTRIACVGASLGAGACSSIADIPELIGLVMISGPNHGGPILGTYPKLFMSAEQDITWAESIRATYEASADPKEIIIFPDTSQHGLLFFSDSAGEEFLAALVDFTTNLP